MPDDRPPTARFDRRRFLAWASALGLGAGALPTLLAQEAEKAGAITAEAIRCAEQLAGLEFTDAERELMLEGVNEAAASYAAVRGVGVGNEVQPALRFDPMLPGETRYEDPARERGAEPAGERQAAPDAGPATHHAFASAADLGRLLHQRRLRSVDLTRAYLGRLKQYDPALECVVTLTEERALTAAEAADRRLDAGDARGPLDG
ncbi:MAG TPA: amidase, partial [Thermoanaerobaculia bacterium]|nr:amidase [Thermoanaerobaculia bacterium]